MKHLMKQRSNSNTRQVKVKSPVSSLINTSRNGPQRHNAPDNHLVQYLANYLFIVHLA